MGTMMTSYEVIKLTMWFTRGQIAGFYPDPDTIPQTVFGMSGKVVASNEKDHCLKIYRLI
jgi:hypothetical protein